MKLFSTFISEINWHSENNDSAYSGMVLKIMGQTDYPIKRTQKVIDDWPILVPDNDSSWQ